MCQTCVANRLVVVGRRLDSNVVTGYWPDALSDNVYPLWSVAMHDHLAGNPDTL